MAAKMTDKKLIKTYKTETFGPLIDAKFLAYEHGFRIRQTKRTKDASSLTTGSLWELSTTYYYQSQNEVARHLRGLQELAEREGFSVQPVRIGYFGDYVREVAEPKQSDIEFDGASWPKQSWATLFIRIVQK